MQHPSIDINRLRRLHSDAQRLHAGLMEVGQRHRHAINRRNDARLELERFEEALPVIPNRRNDKVSGPNQQEKLDRRLKELRGALADAQHTLDAVEAEQESQSEGWQLAKRLEVAGVKYCHDNGIAVPNDIGRGY